MGYVDTEHYKLKKPEVTNKYNVTDMNNALDAVDALLFKQNTENKAAIQEIDDKVKSIKFIKWI